jgi:Prophage minor tail protein Z (GPZ)
MIAVAIVPSRSFEEAEKALAGISRAYPAAARNAINRGLVAGRKVAAQAISGKYNIKSTAVKGAGMEIHRATTSSLVGALTSKGPMLPVSLFSPAVRMKAAGRGGRKYQNVTVTIIKGRGNRKVIKGAFRAGQGGGIVERKQPARLPVATVMTIGVPIMLGSLGISKKVERTMLETTEKTLAREVDFRLTKAGFK